jgi:DNA-binding transcriptional MerR regulator
MLDPELEPESESQEIPNKLYFRIGEVSRLAGIKPHVLRFWETEFAGIGPKKSGTGQRLYRRKDVELVLEIKRLLYEKRFTIEGARKFLEDQARNSASTQPADHLAGRSQSELFQEPIHGLDEVKKELRAILDMLK